MGFPFPSLVHLGVGVGAEQVGLDSLESLQSVRKMIILMAVNSKPDKERSEKIRGKSW